MILNEKEVREALRKLLHQKLDEITYDIDRAVVVIGDLPPEMAQRLSDTLLVMLLMDYIGAKNFHDIVKKLLCERDT